MSGRDQRRALFSLKQIFQDDKDLVHEFVQNEGLSCLIRLGRECDQTHQNHILRGKSPLIERVNNQFSTPNFFFQRSANWCYMLTEWMASLDIRRPYAGCTSCLSRRWVSDNTRYANFVCQSCRRRSLFLLLALCFVALMMRRVGWEKLHKVLKSCSRCKITIVMFVFCSSMMQKRQPNCRRIVKNG